MGKLSKYSPFGWDVNSTGGSPTFASSPFFPKWLLGGAFYPDHSSIQVGDGSSIEGISLLSISRPRRFRSCDWPFRNWLFRAEKKEWRISFILQLLVLFLWDWFISQVVEVTPNRTKDVKTKCKAFSTEDCVLKSAFRSQHRWTVKPSPIYLQLWISNLPLI